MAVTRIFGAGDKASLNHGYPTLSGPEVGPAVGHAGDSRTRRLYVIVAAEPLPDWLADGVRELQAPESQATASDWQVDVRRVADLTDAVESDSVLLWFGDTVADLRPDALSGCRHWLLSDAKGARLAWVSPLLVAITRRQGLGLQLLERSAGGTAWYRRRSSRRACSTDIRTATGQLSHAWVALVRQALIDLDLGVQPLPVPVTMGPAARLRGYRRHVLWGYWCARLDHWRAQWLSEYWDVGLVDAPLSDWLRAGGRLPVRWLLQGTPPGYWADPMGLPGDDRRLFCEYFDERTGRGHIEALTIAGPFGEETVARRERLSLGDGAHVSFPFTAHIDRQRIGLLESSASGDCLLYRVDDQGRWTPWVTLLKGVPVADPVLFTHDGRYWLACTELAHGQHDSLSLYYAPQLEGPWLPHANNPVKVDVAGSRMAGPCVRMASGLGREARSMLVRPAQNCLGGYGSGLTWHHIVRCTPTEFLEEEVGRTDPDPRWPGSAGLHTVSEWEGRTLIDAKRMAPNHVALWRKLRMRLLGAVDVGATALTTVPMTTDRLCIYLPTLRMGGGELSLLRLAERFAREGMAVDLVVHNLSTAELSPPPGVSVTELGVNGTLPAIRRLAGFLRHQRPTWLLSGFPHTNVAAVAAATLAGCPTLCVVSEHAPLSLQIAQQGGWRYRWLPPLVRWAYRRAGAVVAVSEGVRRDLHGMLGPDVPIHVVGNPVLDDHEPDGGPSATRLHPWLLDPSLDVVLSVSRLSPEKDIRTLLRAFALVHGRRPDTRLLIAGEGPQREEIEAWIVAEELVGLVELPGRIHQPMTWMRQACVFALASQYEGFGNVLVEALAVGLPVVSTDCPVGPREALADGRFGELVPVGDAPAMADALVRAMDRPHPPAGVREHVQQYTVGHACVAYQRVFDRLAGGAWDRREPSC